MSAGGVNSHQQKQAFTDAEKEDPRGCEGQANGNVLKQSLVRQQSTLLLKRLAAHTSPI
ncbi:hypothetical protein AERO8C_170025 [Aeromonas veronii]|uniref:Uncharacterized protein n=1 Tax=Aeromonas veronii TaxID=654 RepID=A0A653L0I5_AERVE|nr:hypothetical protein AERO8C_170025 [Aeromonas veronii]